MAESVFIEVDCPGVDVSWVVVWSDGVEVVRERVPGVSGPLVEFAVLASTVGAVRRQLGEKLDQESARRLAEGRLTDVLADGLWHRIDDVLDALAGPWRVREADRKLVHRLAGRGVVRRRWTGKVAWFAKALPVEVVPVPEVVPGVPAPVALPKVRARTLPRADGSPEWRKFRAKKKPKKDWDALAQGACWRALEGGPCTTGQLGGAMRAARRQGRSFALQTAERERDLAWVREQIEFGTIYQDVNGMWRKAKKKRLAAGGGELAGG